MGSTGCGRRRSGRSQAFRPNSSAYGGGVDKERDHLRRSRHRHLCDLAGAGRAPPIDRGRADLAPVPVGRRLGDDGDARGVQPPARPTGRSPVPAMTTVPTACIEDASKRLWFLGLKDSLIWRDANGWHSFTSPAARSAIDLFEGPSGVALANVASRYLLHARSCPPDADVRFPARRRARSSTRIPATAVCWSAAQAASPGSMAIPSRSFPGIATRGSLGCGD